MYNGIGLRTARGSGTNGYVQKSLAYIPARKQAGPPPRDNNYKPPVPKKANEEILDHERKRQIELKLLRWLEENNIEEDKMSPEDFDALTSSKREELTKLAEAAEDEKNTRNLQETHQRAQAKERETDQFRKALGIDDEYLVGAAFDKELQEKKREEKMKERLQEEVSKLKERKEKEKLEQQREKPATNEERSRMRLSERSRPRPRSRSRSRSPDRSRRDRDDRNRDSRSYRTERDRDHKSREDNHKDGKSKDASDDDREDSKNHKRKSSPDPKPAKKKRSPSPSSSSSSSGSDSDSGSDRRSSRKKRE